MTSTSKRRIKKWVVYTLTILCFAVVSGLICLLVNFRTTRRCVLAEAKNAEFALRLMGMEYYGLNEDPFEPLNPNGMADGVEEEIKALSGAEGDVSLVSWNGTEHAPERLVYQARRFVIVFDGSRKTESERWSIYYRFR